MKSICRDIATYNSTSKVLQFTNGSTIEFMYCARDGDLDRVQGLEFDVIFLDEAAQLSEWQMKAITATVRGVNDFPKRVYYTCNPGGQGHAYIKRVFIDRQFLPTENPDDYTFIQALVDDNTALMKAQPEYLAQLEALPRKLREAWRFGRWDVFEGQVFGEFTDDPEHYLDHRWTHVIEPFEIPDNWTIYRGYDHGYAKPFSVGWYAVSPAERIYRIRELYGCTGEADVGVEWYVDEIAQKILEIERDDPNLKGRHIYGVADSAIFASQTGVPISETFEEYGIYFDKSDKNRLPGKMQCHYRLAFDEEGLPMFYVFNTCKNFIRTIPALLYSPTDPEDVDTKMEDHCLIGDTEVWTENGVMKIIDMVGTEGFAYSSDGNLHRYSDVRKTQEDAPVFKMTLEDGSTITATENHRFMLADGSWKELKDLKEGDELWTIG